MICKNCGNEVKENAAFCGVCGMKVENESFPQEEVAKNVVVSLKKQAEETVVPAEEIRDMDLFEKIKTYKERGLDNTAEYAQFAEVKNLAYLLWKLRYLLISCIISFGMYGINILYYDRQNVAGASCLVLAVGLILTVEYLNKTKIIRKLLMVNSNKSDKYISNIFWEEHKFFCKILIVISVINFIRSFVYLLNGAGLMRGILSFGVIQTIICSVWTFKRYGVNAVFAFMSVMLIINYAVPII